MKIFNLIINKISFEITKFNSLLFCLKYLPFQQAKKIPILISPHVKIDNLCRGNIQILGVIRPYQIKIGLKSGSDGLPEMSKGSISVKSGGVIKFLGTAIISESVGLRIESSTFTIGDGFYCNKNCYFRITKDTCIGSDVMFGWNVKMTTLNGHELFKDGVAKINEESIEIGNHVWIASDTIICKGVKIQDGSLVAQMSLVNKHFDKKNVLLGGVPAKVLAFNYNWIR